MSAPRKPLIKSPLFWLIGTLIIAVLCGRPTTLPRQPGLAMSGTAGYKAAVDQLVARKCLQFVDQDGRDEVVFVKGVKGCPSEAVFERYRDATFLSGDMAGLIAQRWQFDGDRSLSAIRSNAHSLRFAAEDRSIWGGTIEYDAAFGKPPGAHVWGNSSGKRQNFVGCDLYHVEGNEAATTAKLDQFGACGRTLWQRARPVRSLSELNESAERMREPTMASIVRRLEVSGMEGSVITSIRHDLHFEMQALLEAHLADAKDIASRMRKKDRTIRAGILLMDGLTGEIHAAATHPAKLEDIDDGGPVNWIDKNWNFERMPVGSTAKVPFAAAIIEAKPELRTAAPRPGQVQCQGNPNCKEQLTTLVGRDFVNFIAISSNSRALWLLDQARRDNAKGWEDKLRSFACLEPYRGELPDTCNRNLWRTEAENSRGADEPRLQLEMDKVADGALYKDYYTNILGAGRWGWTSVNLAQAYARIFSDRPINPRLTPGNRETDPLGISSKTWTAIRDGMAGVLSQTQGGTAYLLCKAIGCAVERANKGNLVQGNLWLYAKTGTATIGKKRDNSKTLVLLAVRTKNGASPQKPSDISELKVIVITQKFEYAGKNPPDLAAKMFNNTELKHVRKWLGLAKPQPVTAGGKR